ncbi:hypothetical protein APHAL10511_005544 [Amanita phalloides]|nr:hypothetical protein APHAL10511_005544 [Amanita phalloides]
MPHPVVVLRPDFLTNDWGVLVVEITHNLPSSDMFKPLKNYYPEGTMIPPPWNCWPSTGSPINDQSVINVGKARVVLTFQSVFIKAAWDLNMDIENVEDIEKSIQDHKMEQSRPPWLSVGWVLGMGYDSKGRREFFLNKHILSLLVLQCKESSCAAAKSPMHKVGGISGTSTRKRPLPHEPMLEGKPAKEIKRFRK